MKKYNWIVVLDQSKTKVLFCKRQDRTNEAIYHFIGGEVRRDEDSLIAAYRELYKETGIIAKEIELFHMMDLTYYHQEIQVEVFAARLSEKNTPKEVEKSLNWLSVWEDFSDENKFGGNGGIVAHVLNVAQKIPFQESVAEKEESEIHNHSLCIGVDGCKGGWIAAVIDREEVRVEKYSSMEQIVSRYPVFDEFLIDMVIGFPDCENDVRPDSLARKIVVPRTSTIFPVPCRTAVYASTEKEQILCNQQALGKSLAKQTMAIIPKMKELDTFLNENDVYKNVIKESHPEVCFARLNGSVVMSKKSEKDGMLERVDILKKYVPMIVITDILQKAKQYKCNADDIVDALCLAVTANLNVQGKAEPIPARPQKDAMGLEMQMIIPKK